MLTAVIAILSGSALASFICIAIQHARRRNVPPDVSQTVQQESGVASSDPVPRTAAPDSKLRLYVSLIVAILGGVLLWKRYGSGEGPYQRSCTGPPSISQRLSIFPYLHGFHHGIHTTSQKAQTLFDQGLLFAWDFNQPEALKSFELAAELDSEASMLAWGVQYAIGPGANRAAVSKPKEYPAFTPEQFGTVQSASNRALALARQAVSKGADDPTLARDLAFAEAASLRWPDGSQSGAARDQAEKRYSLELQQYGEREKDSAALAMAAEAIMNLNPWDYYLPNGSMKATAQTGERLIRAALALDAQNPLANHLLIHISEASSTLRTEKLSAARGEAAANRMHFSKGPWNAYQGHLQHMPSHTFVRIGRYHDAAVSNVKAFNADLKLAQHCMTPYEPEHNTDMLIYTAAMAGEVKTALEFAQRIKEFTSLMFYGGLAGHTSNWAKYPLVLVQFGKWADLFKLPAPGPNDRANCPAGGPQFAKTVWRFARVMALAARTQGAQIAEDAKAYEELNSYLDKYIQQLEEASKLVQPEEQTNPPAVYLCEHRGLADIYELIAKARVSHLRGVSEDAISQLRQAVKIEDAFLYMEPPRVYQPVRQCLGYVLLESGHPKEAEQVYRKDLVQYPDNGWSLHGLSAALHAQGVHAGVDAIRHKLEAAWAHAQDNVDSSCLAFSRSWGEPSYALERIEDLQ